MPLEPKALRVLVLFVQNPGKLLQKDLILDTVWKATFVEESTLTRAVAILRKQLGDDARAPTYIETVPTLGYRFIAKVEAASLTELSKNQADAKSLPKPVEVPEMDSPVPRVEQHGGAVFDLPEEIPSHVVPTTDPVSRGELSRSIKWSNWNVLLVFLLVAGGTVLWFRFRHPPIPEVKKTIVLSDFDNSTDDPVFDGTLREGLTVQLEQSPILSLVSQSRIQNTLRLMNRPPQSHLSAELAREVCQRTESAAMLDGSIAPLGN